MRPLAAGIAWVASVALFVALWWLFENAFVAGLIMVAPTFVWLAFDHWREDRRERRRLIDSIRDTPRPE